MQLAIQEACATHLLAAFASAYPNVAMVWDNGPFDWNNAPPLFVEAEVVFYDGEQTGMAASPKRRMAGYLYYSVYARQGAGTRAARGVVDWLDNRFKFARVGGALFQAPEPDGSTPSKGWHVLRGKVPFKSDPG